jgi:hypothetical protein
MVYIILVLIVIFWCTFVNFYYYFFIDFRYIFFIIKGDIVMLWL